jgi:ferredoxin
MLDRLFIFGWVALALLVVAAFIFAATSAREREWRAFRMTLLMAAITLSSLLVSLLFDLPGRRIILAAELAVGMFLLLVLVLPVGKPKSLHRTGEQERIDERDALFHRFYRLEKGSPDFASYYALHPEKASLDDKIRALPKLGAPGGRAYDLLNATRMNALFDVQADISGKIDCDVEPASVEPSRASSAELTRQIKQFARYLGADLVGCTRLDPAHVYSHIGRSPGNFGEPIELDHSHALVVGMEMSHSMVHKAPNPPSTTETALRYLEAGSIALVLSRYIGLLGYSARAHIDANYRVMCVPVAVDAGLGELGRLGLLVTRKFGPRVRLAVVTTDLELEQDDRQTFGVQDFCEICRKCAINCPSGSIDRGEKQIRNGNEKWQSQQDSCYRFWRQQGSDCGICIRVCPYSHPSSMLHNLVRWLIRRNAFSRRLMLLGDDLFYGRRP